MLLSELYLYLSRFVPLKVQQKNFPASGKDETAAIAAALQAEALNIQSDERIETISDYLFLGDQDFVLERLRNCRGQVLMVDSDRLDYQPDRDDGMVYSLAITVACPYNQSNASVVQELAVQERCLETLKRILRAIVRDSELNHCIAGIVIDKPIEIRFFSLKALNGLIGYTAFFSVKTSDYDIY